MPSTSIPHSSSTDPTTGLRTLTTSMLRGKLGEVMDELDANGECVLLVTHAKPKAVLVPYEKFLAMTSEKPRHLALDFLASSYERLAASMDTPAARAGAREAFDASPEAFSDRPLRE